MKETLDRIAQDRLVLPAIQREFVWVSDTARMTRLFDSLLRKYPIGTFLFWDVPAGHSQSFDFYKVMRDWHERDQKHNPRLELESPRDLTAVLDGQQRLTTLNVGLRGSIALRGRYKRATSLDAYPTRYLYVDLLFEPTDDSEVEFRFEFLTPQQAEPDKGAHWYLVNDILKVDDPGIPLFEYVQEHGLAERNRKQPFMVLSKLFHAVHEDGVVSAFEEKGEKLDRVLDIFVRVNSGGLVLSKSDLLLSMATAHFRNLDAREEIHRLVDELNTEGAGFSFSKDLVLKAGLVLTGISDIGFRVENFTTKNMAVLEENWDRLSQALRLAVRLLSSFGFSEQTLPAGSVLIPIADYAYQRQLGDAYITREADRADRVALRGWLLRTILMPGVWGSGLDSLLRGLHRVIADSAGPFPVEGLEAEMARRGKALDFHETLIDDLLDTPYKHARAFALLSLLYERADSFGIFHVDHVFPRSLATRSKLLAAGVRPVEVEDIRDKVERLPNLQLLEGPANIAKEAQLPCQWMRHRYPSEEGMRAVMAQNDLLDLPDSFTEFTSFYAARRALMRERLVRLLGATRDSSGMPSDTTDLPSVAGVSAGESRSAAPVTDATASPRVPGHRPHATVNDSSREVAGTGKRRRKRFEEELADLIADGRLRIGQLLYADHRGRRHEAVVEPDGLRVGGHVYANVTPAAQAVNGDTPVNGWGFWRTADGRPVGSLRRR